MSIRHHNLNPPPARAGPAVRAIRGVVDQDHPLRALATVPAAQRASRSPSRAALLQRQVPERQAHRPGAAVKPHPPAVQITERQVEEGTRGGPAYL
jgi:hypothetical protein